MSRTPSLFEPDTAPAQLPPDAGTQVVVRSHTRHIRKGIEQRNKARPQRKRETLEQRFIRYHEANPTVYKRLVRMARELKARGVNHYGMAALYEVLRYEALVTTDTDALPFKLSNNHRAYYSRLIHKQEPDLNGFFRLRSTRS